MPSLRGIPLLSACVSGALAVACATPPGYEAAARAARENAESAEGAIYARRVQRDFARRRILDDLRDAVRVCQIREPQSRGVHLLFRLDASGEPVETIAYPDTPFGDCVLEDVALFPLPPPPRADYWFGLRVPPRSNLPLGRG